MPDPIVGIVNGVPTSGTGNITTLGQTLLDGANITFGASTDLAVAAGAAGSISAKLRSISRDIAGGIVLQGGANVIGAVTQSGGPWSVSGTIAATQSGAWNITNITGTVSLPTGAATSANQPTNAAIASATAGQSGQLAMGAAGTSAPSYTNGQTNPLSLTLAGALRVDGSAATQPVSGTVTATQSGTWTVQPGNTANTTPWLTTINQGGNAATVSVAGALKVDGSAVTQPMSAAALPLPAGASTAALQPTNAAQGSTTSGQTGPLVQGAVATTAPTYVNGQTSPISLTTTGAARIAIDATSNTVSAFQGGSIAWAVTQSGNWSTRTQDGAGNLITSDARGSARPLAVEILDASGNQITTFGGSGGTASNYGSAFPTTGTAIGAKDSAGVNMQPLNLNASGALKVDGSAVTQPVSGTFWQTTQPVSGTFWQATQPVSAAALPLPAGASTSALQPTNAGIGSTTSGQTGGLAFGAVTTGAPAYTTAQSNPLSLTTVGALRVDGSAATQPISGSVSITGTIAATQSGVWNITNITGTVSLPTGAATSANQPTNAGLGSNTIGQSGYLGLGAVTTAAPAYTTATSNALSLTTVGALRVDASATTQPISGTVTANQGGVWTVQPGNTANTTPWLTTSRIVGNSGAILDFIGQNVAAPANAILIGAEFNTTPTTITSGNASPLQLDAAGNLLVNIKAGAGSGGTASTVGAAMPSTATVAMGSVTTAAPTYTTATANALSLTTAGAMRIDGSGVTQPVSGTFWQATQPVSGTFWQATQPISGTVTANQGGVWNVTNITGTISLPTGAATSALQPTNATQGSATSGQTGHLMQAAVTTAAPGYTTAQTSPLSLTTVGNLRVDGSSVTQPVSGTFFQATQPVSIAAAVTVAQATAANLNATVTGTVAATQSGTWTVQQGTPPWLMGGDVASGAADSGNPIKIGGVARTALPTAVAAGQRVNGSFDKMGKQLVAGAAREQKGVQKTSITVATETTVVTAGAAGVFNDVYAIVVTNKSATAVFVDFRDATAGTVRMTLSAPANDTRGFTVPVDSAMVQAVAANNWTATVSSAVTSIEITMLYALN